MRRWTTLLLTLVLAVSSAAAAQILTPFAGSTAVGNYEAEFARFHHLVGSGKDVDTVALEGRLSSRIFKKPDAKSNYEVFRSYEKELKAAGFGMLAVLDDVKSAELLVRKANDKAHNNLVGRPYALAGKAVGVGTKGQVGSQARHYIAAEKSVDDKRVIVVISTSRSGNYLVEQFEIAAMEAGTVTLSLDNLRQKIASEGRIAIYGIHFDTGSAQIKPASADTIATIVQYLQGNPERHFYVVGHTDDQGVFASNMALSRARAEAVVDAVTARLPDAKGRLAAHGVGPLSPVATNGAADGRELNRRVELVSVLK